MNEYIIRSKFRDAQRLYGRACELIDATVIESAQFIGNPIKTDCQIELDMVAKEFKNGAYTADQVYLEKLTTLGKDFNDDLAILIARYADQLDKLTGDFVGDTKEAAVKLMTKLKEIRE